MFRFFLHATRTVATGALVLVFGACTSFAVDVFPLDKDMNLDGLGFGGLTDAFVFGGFGIDANATFHGQDILVQSGGGHFSGAGLSIPVSNGENGYTETFDTNTALPNPPNNESNPDPNNTTPANSVWSTIGNVTPAANPTPPNPVTGTPNPRVGLNNGNVIRFSLWIREDPSDPITVTPQIEPVIKFEFWKEGLSTFADTNGGQAQPFYGDKVVDTDQHLGQGIWIDLDGNGTVADPLAAGEGRIRTISTDAWTLIDVEYEVDDSSWFGIDDDVYTVADIEEVRSVMFWGDFLPETNPSPAGSLWFDNALVEIFPDQAAANANPVASSNPSPVLDEMPSADFDNDGDVDGDDFLSWQRGFGTSSGAATTDGDADYDEDVDHADLVYWESQYASLVAAVDSVPEPSTGLLTVMGLLCLMGRRQNRR